MASQTKPPTPLPFGLPADTPSFTVTTRPEAPTDRDDTDTVFGVRTYGDIAREIDKKLGRTAPRKAPSRE